MDEKKLKGSPKAEGNTKTWYILLHKAFEDKKKRNPSYSLSAFARDLDISQPQLSRLMNCMQDLSPLQAHKLSKLLHLSPLESYELIVSTLNDEEEIRGESK